MKKSQTLHKTKRHNTCYQEPVRFRWTPQNKKLLSTFVNRVIVKIERRLRDMTRCTSSALQEYYVQEKNTGEWLYAEVY